MRRRATNDESLKRKIAHTLRFNSKEQKAIDHYCRKFRIKNRAKFMREAIITEILQRFDKNYPTFWDDGQLRLF
jgi:hypothetical protein